MSTLNELVNGVGNVFFGISQSGVAGHLGMAATSAGGALGYLPPFAVIAGISGILSSLSTCGQPKGSRLKESVQIMEIPFNGFLVYEGMHTMSGLVLGTAGCTMLFAAFALKAIVDLMKAVEKYRHATAKELKTASLSVIKEIIAVVGWTLLAVGHPLGWACLLSAGVLGLGLLASRSTYLGGPGLFRQSRYRAEDGQPFDLLAQTPG